MTGTAPIAPVVRPTRAVGSPRRRIDGLAKVTGTARFSAEYPYEDLVYAVPVFSTTARATITDIDTSVAEALDGVLAVLTHRNVAPLLPVPEGGVLPSMLASTVEYLQTDQVHWNGQPVALVVATTTEIADHAASLVVVSYRPYPADSDFAARFDRAYAEAPSPIAVTTALVGDPDAALQGAAVAVDNVYRTPRYNHNALEPHATTAAFVDGDLVVHDGSQQISAFRQVLADKFGLPQKRVRVISRYVGGAFGGKTMVWANTVLAVLATRAVGRPVRLTMSRAGVYRTVGGRTESVQRVALGADRDGRLTSVTHVGTSTQSRVGGFGEALVAASSQMYAAPNARFEQHLVELDIMPNTIMRAPGESIGSFAMESAIDELASRLGLDPIELRLRNEPAVSPIDGSRFSSRNLVRCLRAGRDQFGWAARRAMAPEQGRYLVGVGVASAMHPAWRFAADVRLRLRADHTALVQCGLHEMGMGGATAQTMVAADVLGLSMSDVTFEWGDSALPLGPGAGGSAQTASTAASILAAAEKLKGELLCLVPADSPLRGLRSEEAALVDGRLVALADSSTGHGYRELLAAADRTWIEVRTGDDDPDSFARRTITDMMAARDNQKASFGAQFCGVRINRDTGELRVTDWTGVFDIGRVVNPKTADSQLRGGIVMGIGMALLEATLTDVRTGRIVNPSLTEYHVPVHADVPPIDVHCLNIPDPGQPLGILGAGEVGIIGTAAAIANAVAHATGRRLRTLPITLDQLF
jgi:xanthine dehydrogenase YagR molybdenum-binding subunit